MLVRLLSLPGVAQLEQIYLTPEPGDLGWPIISPQKNIIFVVTFLSLASPEVFNSGYILELPEEILKIQILNTQYFVKTHYVMLILSHGCEQWFQSMPENKTRSGDGERME